MLCIDNNNTNIYFNLAAEEYLLKNFREDILMLWQSAPAVVIGKYQCVENEVNIDYIKKQNIRIARRMTGGGAVYHDLGNLNISYIKRRAPDNYSDFTNRLAGLLSPLVGGLRTDERNNLFINNMKISGSAQCVHKDASLHHCSLLFSSQLEVLYISLFPVDAHVNSRIKTVESVRSKVTNMKDHLIRKIDFPELKMMILEYFLNYPGENRIYQFSEDEQSAIGRLASEKYMSSSWIFRF
ncbi:MAG: lipoate--protein ligase family protein [Dysgonamonadaceae bacterium]|jgi:lipoate-protein ligase A|nr:lipoate--protein ligase family protein [Dysgonamonadaceae bacterium]